jgi:hypothetical protein
MPCFYTCFSSASLELLAAAAYGGHAQIALAATSRSLNATIYYECGCFNAGPGEARVRWQTGRNKEQNSSNLKAIQKHMPDVDVSVTLNLIKYFGSAA